MKNTLFFFLQKNRGDADCSISACCITFRLQKLLQMREIVNCHNLWHYISIQRDAFKTHYLQNLRFVVVAVSQFFESNMHKKIPNNVFRGIWHYHDERVGPVNTLPIGRRHKSITLLSNLAANFSFHRPLCKHLP